MPTLYETHISMSSLFEDIEVCIYQQQAKKNEKLRQPLKASFLWHSQTNFSLSHNVGYFFCPFLRWFALFHRLKVIRKLLCVWSGVPTRICVYFGK